MPRGRQSDHPRGRVRRRAPLVLKDGVTIRGEGVNKTILTMSAQSQPTALIGGDGVIGATISDLTLSSPSPRGNVFGIWISNYVGITVERVRAQGCTYGLKADTRGEDLNVRDFVARGCGQNYISNLQGGTFENLDLEAVTERLASDMTFHTLYLGTNNRRPYSRICVQWGGAAGHCTCTAQVSFRPTPSSSTVSESRGSGRW